MYGLSRSLTDTLLIRGTLVRWHLSLVGHLDLDHPVGVLAGQVARTDVAGDLHHLRQELDGPEHRVALLAAEGRHGDGAALLRVEGGEEEEDMARIAAALGAVLQRPLDDRDAICCTLMRPDTRGASLRSMLSWLKSRPEVVFSEWGTQYKR